MIRRAPNINHLWAQLIVEELVRCSVTQFFLAPGSRSTPLATAVAQHESVVSVVHFDERGTAFAALGYARATGKPAVWLTTSGTALANGLPAAIEASVDAVPLILLTADRPPELRRTGANQTILQPGLYGEYVQWAFDGPAPNLEIPPTFVLSTIDQAVHRSRSGPVHLNWMFREPLAPEEDRNTFDNYLEPLSNWQTSDQPLTRYPRFKKRVDAIVIDQMARELSGVERGIVIAGRMARPGQGNAVLRLADTMQWPVLVDVGSQAMFGAGAQELKVAHYDYLLDSPAFKEGPDVVLQFGRRFTSKKLQRWIGNSDVQQHILVDDYADRIDPEHQVSMRIEADIESFCMMLNQQVDRSKSWKGNWVERWSKGNARVAHALDLFFEDHPDLSEPAVARSISKLLPERHGLILANSMPVRDMDVFGACGKEAEVHVFMNRGASGIDGTVATAVGAVWGLKQPATLMIGDLSLLHDLNSLALIPKLPNPLIIVVVNNDGGGIFSFLPISSYKGVFETHFASPHGLNFKASSKMFNLAYEAPLSITDFESVYRKAVYSGMSTIIEIQTDREENLALHKAIATHVAPA